MARIAIEFIFELNTTVVIPYLQAAMYSFVYHLNTIIIALYYKEKSISLTNKKIGSTIPDPRKRVVKGVGDKAQYEKMRWIITKENNRRNFQSKNSQLLMFTLAKEVIFSSTRPKSVCGKSIDFLSQPREMLLPKQLNE